MPPLALKRPLVAPALAVALLVATVDPASAATLPPPPNQQPYDEVRLTNGGFVRGRISELSPGNYVILDSRNESRRFEWSELESVVQSDGTVHTKDAVPMPLPDPKPDPEPDPLPDGGEPDAGEPDAGEPDAGEPDEGEPDAGEPDEFEPDEAEPDAFDPDELDEPDEAEAEAEPAGPTPATPLVVIDVDGKGSPVELRSFEGPVDAKVDPSGGTVVCKSPCDLQLPSVDGEFFATIDGKQVGRSFRFEGGSPNYTLDVERMDPIKRWSGVALIPATLLIGIGVGIIPVLHNIPRSQVAGYAAGGAVISLLGIGGGVTLILFSRSKVEVLPGISKGGE